MQYERIYSSEGIDTNKTNASKECMLCHYWYFKDLEFKFKSNACIRCSTGRIFLETKNVAILNAKGIDDRWILRGIDKNKAVSILNNSVLKDKSVIVLKNFVLEDRDLVWIDFGASVSEENGKYYPQIFYINARIYKNVRVRKN